MDFPCNCTGLVKRHHPARPFSRLGTVGTANNHAGFRGGQSSTAHTEGRAALPTPGRYHGGTVPLEGVHCTPIGLVLKVPVCISPWCDLPWPLCWGSHEELGSAI